MTIQQLQYVVALDTHRQFVKAAESCFVTQPTLTLQLKKLEDEISLILFDRSSQPLDITPMGALFVQKARRILREVEELKALVNDDRNQIDGTFTLGIIPTLSPYLLPLFIKDFIATHPNTKLVIEEIQSERIIQLLKNKELDLGILATPIEESDIKETPLFYEPFLVYTDIENDLLNLEKLEKENLKPDGLWILKQGHCFRNQTLNICKFDATDHHKNIEIEGGSIETLKKMIKEVSGYTLIPELSYDDAADADNIVRFNDPQPVREISLITHKHFNKELLINELRKSIINSTPASFKKNTKFKKVMWR